MDRGVVTYSNKAKQELLGVSPAILRKYGAVSAQVAEAMAKGIRVKSQVDLGVSVTGIAGPGGGSAKKPVGLVYMAIDGPRGSQSQRWQFWGNRTEIKFRSSQAALDMIRRYCTSMNVEGCCRLGNNTIKIFFRSHSRHLCYRLSFFRWIPANTCGYDGRGMGAPLTEATGV